MPFVQFQLRRGLASEWASVNPILAQGELGLESDTKKVKVGNGIDSWSSLQYGIGYNDLYAVTSTGNTTNVAINITNTAMSSNTVSGALTVTGGVGIGGNLNVGGNITANIIATSAVIGNATTVTVNTSPVVIDSFNINSYSTVKYIIRAVNSTNYHSMEAFLVNDGVDAYITIYASLKNNINLISLSAAVNGSNVELTANGYISGNSVKIFATRL